MILLERAHTNLQAVFTNGWLDDDAYNSMLDQVLALSPDLIQYIGACVDETTLPVPDENGSTVQLALSEYIALLESVTVRDLLTRQEIEAFGKDKELFVPLDAQKRILTTTFLCLKYQETDTAQTLITALEDATKGKLQIGTEVETLLYRKLYLMLVCKYMQFMPESRMIAIFSSSLFTLAVFMDLLLLPALEEHIRYFSLVEVRRQLSLDYAASIASNKAPFGVNAKDTAMTVQDWMLLFQKKAPNVSQEEFFKVLEADPDIQANPKEIAVKIEMILFLYRLLVSGYFILEEGARGIVDQMVKELAKEHQTNLLESQPVSFADILNQPQELLALNLKKTETLQALVTWMANYPTKQEAVHAFMTLLATTIGTIPQQHTDVVSALFYVVRFLSQQGYPIQDVDLLYFDEADGVFRLNAST